MSNTYKFVDSNGSGAFGYSGNWIDETSPATPGPPGSTDTALVETAGTISGTGDVGTLVLDGTGGLLTSTQQTIAATALVLEGQVALKHASSYTVQGDVDQVGTSSVGMSGGSDLYVSPASTVGTVPFDIAVASSDRSTFNLSGLGTKVEVAQGNAIIGDAGLGAMTIGSGAELKIDAGGVILGHVTGGRGVLTVTGPVSALMATGEVQVDQGTLSILAGAEASSLSLNIEAPTEANASVLVSGAGSRLITGDTGIGGETGASSLTVAKGGFAQVGSLLIGSPGYLGTNSVLVEDAGSTIRIHGNLDLGEVAIGPGGYYFHDSGSLTVTAGAQVLQDNGSRDVVGQEGSSTGSIIVAGLGSTLNTGVASIILGDDGTGTVTISSDGHMVSSTSSGSTVIVGNFGTGSVTAVGAGSNWAAAGEFDVGYYGTGTVLVEAGAGIETGSYNGVDGFVLGNQGEGAATITGTGSTLTNSGAFIVGDAGSGTLTISAGGVVSTNVRPGEGVHGAVIGAATGGSGSVDVTGAGSRWAIGSDLVIGNAGSGSLTIADGGQVSAGGTAELTAGSMTLSGGSLDVSQALTLNEGQLLAGHGTVQASAIINAATVQASGGTLTFLGGVTGYGKLEIEAGSTLSLANQVGSGQETLFEGAAGKLALGAPPSFAGTIYNFIKGDTIDLSKTLVSRLSYSGQTLTAYESGGASIKLHFSGAYAKSSFGITSDGHSGTLITHT